MIKMFLTTCTSSTMVSSLLTKSPFCTGCFMSDWINCFCLQKACVHSREWQALIQSITALLWSWQASTVAAGVSRMGFILFQESNQYMDMDIVFFIFNRKKKKKHGRNNPPLFLSPTQRLDRVQFLISPFLFSLRGGSRVEIVWVDEWFVSLRCLLAWGSYQLRLFDILEIYWSA